jgi:DNA-binding response OmpR family regulator
MAALERADYAITLTDIGLPKMSGPDVLKARRQAGAKTPALIITARGGVTDVVTRLDLGADECIVKLIELPVLLAADAHDCATSQ